jgi:hypothetical protein
LNIDPAVSGYRGIRQHLHVTNSGDIGRIASGGAPIATQLLGASFSFLEVTRDNEDLAAISTEYVGDSLPMPLLAPVTMTDRPAIEVNMDPPMFFLC